MKIKFNGMADRATQGINLVPGEIYEVSTEVGEYLMKTFTDMEVLETKTAEPKATEKAKVGTVVKPKD